MGELWEKYRRTPFVSVSLVAANVILFLLECWQRESLVRMGRLDVAGTLFRKEYGRIIWAMFLHADVNHLFSNMIILLFLGAILEREIGHVFFALLYFASGIGGNLLSLANKVMSGDGSASIGASGAIFGMDGMLLALVLFSGRRIENITPARVILMVALSLYGGFSSGNIDNAAHVGGLLTGFALGGILCLWIRLTGRFRGGRRQ